MGTKSESLLETIKLIPGYDPFRDAGDSHLDGEKWFWFDEEAAQLYCDFFPDCLKHVEGTVANQPFELEPFQKAVTANIFGWKRPDGTRRYREVFVYVPRKNVKTTWCAGLANAMFFLDNEPGAQIYCCAAEREQASILFRLAKHMILQEPELKKRCKPQKYVILSGDETSYIKAVSSEAGTKMGYNPHAVFLDELHTQPNAELLEAMETGMVARTQPLVFLITTADYVRDSICNEKHDYACKVRDGIIKDPYFLPVIYEASIDDDWKDPKVWAAANPMLGKSVNIDFFEREVKKAELNPRELNKFRRLHLNIKTESVSRFFNMTKWDQCSSIITPEKDQVESKDWLREYLKFKESLKGQRCWGGLDLASRQDIASFVLAFDQDDSYKVLSHHWIPKIGAERRERKDKIPYRYWQQQGFLSLTEGEIIDHNVIIQDILKWNNLYKIDDVGFDPWNATQLEVNLRNSGLEMVEMRQGVVTMSSPMKELEKLIIGGKLDHAGDPVLRWMASNTDVSENATGLIRPMKPERNSPNKIDGIVACIMALGRAIINNPLEGRTVYDDRPVRMV